MNEMGKKELLLEERAETSFKVLFKFTEMEECKFDFLFYHCQVRDGLLY